MFLCIKKAMNKQNSQMPVRYKQLGSEQGTDFYFERSVDLIFSPGAFTVEIDHTSADVGLPVEYCDAEHYIVGTLIVTDSGTSLPVQTNRTTGQILSITSCESRDTKLYTRTFVNGTWSEWRALACTGMYDSIASTDELLSTVDELVNTTKNIQETIEYEIGHSKALESQDKILLCKAYTHENFAGIWCKDNTTGEILDASTATNSFLIKVSPGEIYRIESASLYNTGSVPFFSEVPTVENYTTVYVGYDGISDSLVVVPKDSAYMLVSVKNPATATARIELVGWADRVISNAVATAHRNIGSEYVESVGDIIAGTKLDMRIFRSLTVGAGAVLEFIAETDSDVEFLIITDNGIAATGSTVFYNSNTLHKVALSENFISALNRGYRWGVLVKAEKAIANTSICFRARIINNDTFSYDNKIREHSRLLDGVNESISNIANTVNEIAIVPNNNNYIKNWDIGNRLVVRLYVENKELAIADKLYIKQFFRLAENNCGFNFGNVNADWALTIAPRIGTFDIYETTNYTCDGVKAKYGKIAIRIDWNAIDWGTLTTINCGKQTECNLEDIVFDWDEFVKPINPSVKLGEESVSEGNLTIELKNKINLPVPILCGYELFSLGDSLSSAGIWQTKVAELTGCLFDQQKNNKPGAMLSVGGTSSFGDTFDNVLWRTKNLIDQNYIQDEGENAIVVLENVNDGYVAFDENVTSVIPTTPIEGYNDSDFGTELLSSISDKAQLNAVLRLNKVVAGKNLKIDNLPTKAGSITLRVGWVGPGYSNYNIYVEPQATDEETLNHVLDKILEYAYTGITDVLGEDGVSVDFSSGNSNYLPTVQFTDTDGTGMTCSVTDNLNAKGSVARYFIGDTIEEWTDTDKWQKGITYSQGWKSAIEMLQRAYPKLHIFVSMFPMHAVTASEYLLPNGSYDTVAYNSAMRMENMRKMEVELKKIAEFYSLPFLNVFAECGIGINNILKYYNTLANVHPKNEGYHRFGETIAMQLQRFLVR